jgi:hypothetical protein
MDYRNYAWESYLYHHHVRGYSGYSAERNNYIAEYHQTHKMKASPPITPEAQILRFIQQWRKKKKKQTNRKIFFMPPSFY